MRRRQLDVDVPKLLVELGVEARKAGEELRGHCPDPVHKGIAGSSAALKKGPGTWQIKHHGPKAGLHKCYSCGFGGGPVALVKAVRGITGPEAWRWLLDFCGETIPAGAYSKSWTRKAEELWKGKEEILPWPDESVPIALDASAPEFVQRARAYLNERGVTDAEIRRHHMAATPPDAKAYKGRAIVPIIVERRMVDFVARLWMSAPGTIPKALSGRIDKGARKELSLWGYDFLDPTIGVVIVVEGLWDALHLLRSGIPNVVACCGSAWSDERGDLLLPWPKVILMPDADAAGRKLVARASGLRFTHELVVAEIAEDTQPEDHAPSEIRSYLRAAKPPTFHDLSPVELAPWGGKDDLNV